MAQLKYLDKTGLEAYDAKIKDYIGAEIVEVGTIAQGYANTALTNAKSYTDTEVASAKTYADQKAGEVLSGTVGSATQPVYLNDGVVTAIGHTIEVDVPSNAKFTDTTYTGGSGISVSGTTINHTNTVTEGVIGQKTNESVAFGGVIDIPYAYYDANGHIVSKGERTVTLPAAPTTITGNAGTATKLQTARTIALGTGVSSTATSFDGQANITIPVTGIKESYLTWGGKNFAGSYGPIDAAMIPDLSANRFMFLNPAGITIEYSTNGGSSWADYGATDSQKRGLFAKESSFVVGKATSSSPATANALLRVTVDTEKAEIYTGLNKFMIFCSTNGSLGNYVTIEKALQSTPANYETVAENVPIDGWPGYNIINVSAFITYGNSASIQYGRIRFTFGITSTGAGYTGLSIKKIAAFGGMGWTTPSTMAKNGHLYSFDNDMNATFPAKVTAEGGFSGSLDGVATSASKLATARTINGASFDGTANITTTNWGTARTITIGSSGKSVNGGANVSWTLSEIGAAASSHTHAKNLYRPTKAYQKVTFTNSTSSATISPYNTNMDIEVYYNGFLLMPNEDYTQSGATITFTPALGGTGVEQTLVIVKRDYS